MCNAASQLHTTAHCMNVSNERNAVVKHCATSRSCLYSFLQHSNTQFFQRRLHPQSQSHVDFSNPLVLSPPCLQVLRVMCLNGVGRQMRAVRALGSCALDLCSVACGRADAMFEVRTGNLAHGGPPQREFVFASSRMKLGVLPMRCGCPARLTSAASHPACACPARGARCTGMWRSTAEFSRQASVAMH